MCRGIYAKILATRGIPCGVIGRLPSGRVYNPKILGKPEQLYKKPGYDPSELP